MKNISKVLFFLLLGLPLGSIAWAVTADNPYHTIVDRNPFSLNPPPPPATNQIVEPPRNVKFNGFTVIGGKKKAFFTIPGKDAKDPPQFVTLAESEQTEILSVTKIMKEEGEVEVVNSGVKMVLNFKNNGNSASGGGSVVAAIPPIMPSPSSASVVYSPQTATSPSSSFSNPSLSPVNAPGNISTPQPTIFNSAASGVIHNASSTAMARDVNRGAGMSVAEQQALMQLNHEALTYRAQTGQRDVVNYSPNAPKNPTIYSPNPSSGPRRMVIDPPPPLPGQ